MAVAVTAVAGFALLPLVTIIAVSLSPSEFIVFPPKGLTLRWYVDAFTSTTYTQAFAFSLLLASAVVVGALLLGVPAAFALVRCEFPGRRVLASMVLGPLFVPGIFLALSLLVFFVQLGIAQTATPLFLGHIVVVLPFVVRFVSVGLVANDIQVIEQAAATLGADPFTVVRRVTLPLIRPALGASILIGFLASFDETVIALFFATPKVMTLPVRLLGDIEFSAAGTLVTAVASMLLVITFVGVLVVDRLYGLDRALIGAVRE